MILLGLITYSVITALLVFALTLAASRSAPKPNPHTLKPISQPLKTMIKQILSLLLLGVTIASAQTNSTLLKVGDAIPDVMLRTEDNKEVKLRALVLEKPTVLIFYRGGWCPFCTRHLKDLAGIEKDLVAADAQLLAISPDQPSKLKATPGRDQLAYRLLSDSAAEAAKAFGIAFKVDDKTIEKYKGYGINLDTASGKDHHLLPHPAVYVVDRRGKINFAHFNPDYKVRLESKQILEAVRAAKE